MSVQRQALLSGSTALSNVEQVIRPTGLVDPEVSVRPVEGQIDDLLSEIHLRLERKGACTGNHFNQKNGGGSHLLF